MYRSFEYRRVFDAGILPQDLLQVTQLAKQHS